MLYGRGNGADSEFLSARLFSKLASYATFNRFKFNCNMENATDFFCGSNVFFFTKQHPNEVFHKILKRLTT